MKLPLMRAVFSEGDAARPITASQPPGRHEIVEVHETVDDIFGLGLDVEAVIETISKGGAQSWQMENRSWALAPIFRLHGTNLPPAGVESGLVAYSTGPAQNRTRTSRSRLIEPSRCSCMPLLETLVSQFFGGRLRAQFSTH
jgi:hypothetical protein